MKYVLIALCVAGAVVLSYVILKDYSERMTQYNKYMCAVYGKEADCKTPLKPENRLK